MGLLPIIRLPHTATPARPPTATPVTGIAGGAASNSASVFLASASALAISGGGAGRACARAIAARNRPAPWPAPAVPGGVDGPFRVWHPVAQSRPHLPAGWSAPAGRIPLRRQRGRLRAPASWIGRPACAAPPALAPSAGCKRLPWRGPT
eukprot:scaffold34281_cov90-Isochrysis_galbana.AAC.1